MSPLTSRKTQGLLPHLLLLWVASSSSITVLAQKCPPGQGYDRFEPEGYGSCEECSRGLYAALVNGTKSVCLECPAGYYSDQYGVTKCKKCPVGTLSFYKGMMSVHDCEPCYPLQGVPRIPVINKAEKDGSLTCAPCPSGTYIAPNKASCLPCAAGRFVTSYRSCDICPAGTKWNGNRVVEKQAHACDACNYNQYQDLKGAKSCKACPVGTYVLSYGSKTKSACKPYLPTKKVSFTESFIAYQHLKVPLTCSTNPWGYPFCTYATQDWVRKAAPRTRTIVSGKPYPCNFPLTSFTSSMNKGPVYAVSTTNERMYCQDYRLYVLRGNKYSLYVRFKFSTYGTHYREFKGTLGKSAKFELRVSYSDGRSSTAVNEIMTWAGIKVA